MFPLMSVSYDFLYFRELADAGFGNHAPDRLKEYLHN